MKREFKSYENEVSQILSDAKINRETFFNDFFRELLGLNPHDNDEDEEITTAARDYIVLRYNLDFDYFHRFPTVKCPECDIEHRIDSGRTDAEKIYCPCGYEFEIRS